MFIVVQIRQVRDEKGVWPVPKTVSLRFWLITYDLAHTDRRAVQVVDVSIYSRGWGLITLATPRRSQSDWGLFIDGPSHMLRLCCGSKPNVALGK